MRAVVSITLLLVLSACALADEPEVVTPLREGEPIPQTTTPDLDVNRAELAGDISTGGQAVMFTRDEAQAVIETQPVSPLMADIRTVLTAERARREELQARFLATREETAALEIQREIEALAKDTELQILQIQIDHARTNGREALAQEIEAAVVRMTTPRPRPVPVDRPAPTNR